MQYRKLGSSGIEASVVAFGAWAIGGWKWGGTDARASIRAIHAALDSGVNFIDTAAVYGFGLSEELVGQAVATCPRDKIVLASKCGLRWDVDTPTLHMETEGRRVFRDLSPDSLKGQLEQSLLRLKTDYIDLYQTHWPDPQSAPSAVMQALLELKAEGKIRAIGFCNASVADIEEASRVAALDVDQEKYSLLDREREADNLPLCEKQGIAFLAYSPMAQGLLTGKIDEHRQFSEGDFRLDSPRFTQPIRSAVAAMLEPITELSKQRSVTTEQLVLAWTLTRPGLSHVLVGARNEEQAKSNALAGSLLLSVEELALIDKAAGTWSGF